MGEVRIIGTAHVSQKSVEEVQRGIDEFQPTIVAVELDEIRYFALKQEGEMPAISDILESGNFTQMLIQWTLAYLQRRIGMDVGVEPGAEMKAAIEEAERHNVPIALIDRDIRVTLSRFWRSMSFIEKLRLIYALSVSMISNEEEGIDVELLTREDMITVAIDEFRKFSPRGAAALIDERDAYLASKILSLKAQHTRVLAVMGAGHVAGVNHYLADPASVPSLSQLSLEPPSRAYGKIFGFIILALFLILIIAIAFSGLGTEALISALLYWVVIHAVLSGIFAIMAGGHPLSALTGAAVSWLTALNPLIAAGWFAAVTEAKIRRPSPADFKRVIQAENFGEMRKIPLFRVVFVAALTNVGSTIATFAYYISILPFLHIDPGVVIFQGFNNLWLAVQGFISAMLHIF